MVISTTVPFEILLPGGKGFYGDGGMLCLQRAAGGEGVARGQVRHRRDTQESADHITSCSDLFM